MRTLLLLLTVLALWQGCAPDRPATEHQRLNREWLLLRGPEADSLAYARLLAALCPLTDSGYLILDTTSQAHWLREDTLRNYASVVMLGWPGEVLSPQQQNHLERYVQAGGGLLLMRNRLRNPLDWPWWQQLMAGPPPDSSAPEAANPVQRVADMLPQDSAQAAPFMAYGFDGGRILRLELPDSLLRAPAFLRQVQGHVPYLIGDNRYDYARARSPYAPHDNRFTLRVLDDFDVDEPMELTVLPDGRVVYIERKGRMKLYSPQTEQTQLLHTFDVCTSGNYEDGLLGLTQDPDFAQNGYLYLYYSPGADCERPQTLSRFVLQGDSLLTTSETVILEVEVQRETCCHSGGSVTFGPDGNLWLSTGDNTSSKESDGYTPIDERPGRAPFDAQKSSANTHDLRGKILRIAPLDSGGYAIPPGNLFPADGSQGRPEIYAMGCRNPFRFSVDHATGWLYWGDVGPDVGDSSRYGPRSYDEWNQARQPGNFGWPYFTANNLAYPDRDFEADTVGALFNPMQPVNHSPYNTGRRKLPPAQPAMIWYPYALSDSFPMLGTGSRSAMAGPVYRQALYDTAGLESAFPAYYEGKLFIYEWARSWIKLVSFDSTGSMNKIEPFLPELEISKPIDLEFGPDGSLYLLTYGQDYFLNNPEARLIKIEYAPHNRLPIPELYVDRPDGAAPHTVNLSAYFSHDYDPADSVLRYYWQFTSTEVVEDSGVEVCFTYQEPGLYHPRLLVVDQAGDTAVAEAEIRVGNAPPQLEIDYAGNRSFYLPGRSQAYEVKIHDPEDEARGGLAPERTEVRWVYVSDGNDLEVMLGEGDVPRGDPRFYQGLMQIRQSDCRTCHADQKESVGPSYQAVAQRYRGQADAVDYLAQKIIQGGNGNWGERMMAAHPQVSLADAQAMVQYILSLDDPAAAGQTLALQGAVSTPPRRSHTGAYLLAATYTDGGADSLPPLSRRELLVLRHPRLQAETADLASPWARPGTWGPNRDLPVRYGLSDQAFMAYRQIDGTGLRSLRLRYLPHRGGRVSIHLDAPDGPEIGQLTLPVGPVDTWQEARTRLRPFTGQHDLYFVFHKPGSREEIAVLDWVEFE
mgnify:CR=1 FL=1